MAICTFNRSHLLARTLESLARQRDLAWEHAELLVIDNNCTDDTAQVVDTYTSQLPIRRVLETAQGHNHARNRALTEFRGDWLIFTDDDVLLSPYWLMEYREAFKNFPQASFAGGRILPDWSGPTPAWFKGEKLDLLDGALVKFDLGAETRLLEADEPEPFGASFALRRSAIDKLGSFDPALGQKGKRLGRGDETVYLRRMKRTGEKGIYVGRAECLHLVDRRRLTLRGLFQYGIASGVGHKAISDASAQGSYLLASILLLRGLIQLVKLRGDRFRQCVIGAGVQVGLRKIGEV